MRFLGCNGSQLGTQGFAGDLLEPHARRATSAAPCKKMLNEERPA